MQTNMIQWRGAQYWDKPWNPMQGCLPISPACEHCYAKSFAERFGQTFEPHATKKVNPPRSGVVFCGNATDLFGDWNIVHENGGYFHRAYDYIAKTLGYDITNPCKDKATYLWLTKRAANMREVLEDGGWEYNKDYWTNDADVHDFRDCDMSNHYFGVTAENQEWFDKRIKEVRMFPSWANVWLSLEPLLGEISLASLPYADEEIQPIKWVVVGCESGKNRRPCRIRWVEDIVRECGYHGIQVFVKQLDIDGKCETDITKFPKHLQIRQVPWQRESVPNDQV